MQRKCQSCGAVFTPALDEKVCSNCTACPTAAKKTEIQKISKKTLKYYKKCVMCGVEFGTNNKIKILCDSEKCKHDRFLQQQAKYRQQKLDKIKNIEVKNTASKKQTSVTSDDMVNHPGHYTTGGIETIDYIKAKLTIDEFRGYLKGTILKYMSRAGYKQNEVEDYQKAQWYINKLMQVVQHVDK